MPVDRGSDVLLLVGVDADDDISARQWKVSSIGHRAAASVDVLGGVPVEGAAGHGVEPSFDRSKVGWLYTPRSVPLPT